MNKQSACGLAFSGHMDYLFKKEEVSLLKEKKQCMIECRN